MLGARVLSAGLVLGLAASAGLGLAPLSAAQAAYPAWSGYASAAKRPQFRPWHRNDPSAIVGRWRPHVATSGRASDLSAYGHPTATSYQRRWQEPLLDSRRAAPRKADPVARGRDVGVSFRPNGRGALLDEGPMTQDQGASIPYGTDAHSQFRPAPTKRKRTYEEMQAANRQGRTSVGAAMPYPTMPGMLPNPYGAYWPAWR
jgi:hypothetical protein